MIKLLNMDSTKEALIIIANAIPLDMLPCLGVIEKDVRRYQYLRCADIDSVYKGGIFVGRTPDNIVINGEDLDVAIDEKLYRRS